MTAKVRILLLDPNQNFEIVIELEQFGLHTKQHLSCEWTESSKDG